MLRRARIRYTLPVPPEEVELDPTAVLDLVSLGGADITLPHPSIASRSSPGFGFRRFMPLDYRLSPVLSDVNLAGHPHRFQVLGRDHLDAQLGDDILLFLKGGLFQILAKLAPPWAGDLRISPSRSISLWTESMLV